MLNKLILKIKRKENKFYSKLNKLGRNLQNFNIPIIKPLYKFLWWERTTSINVFKWILNVFYYSPLFRAMCFKVGRNFYLVNGLPEVNENIKIIIGDNVSIYAKETSFGGGKIIDNPILEIGDNTFIGPGVKIGVCQRIAIGKHCLIAARVIMSDSDGHPLDWSERRTKLPVRKEDVSPIIIEDDVWIGEGCFIRKGVKIGRGAVIGARSVVTNNIPPFSVAIGIPARVIKELQP